MKMKRYLALLTCAVLTAGLLVGCGGGQKPPESSGVTSSTPGGSSSSTGGSSVSEPAAPDPITLNLAYMPNYGALWAVMSAEKNGYFAEEGITVNMVPFDAGPAEIAAMEGGSIDVAYIGHGAHKLCSSGQASILLIQHLGNADCVIGLKSHGVESIADLKGKTVAYAPASSSEIILKLALEANGMTMDDIKGYAMEASNMVAAASSGSVDAIATWSPASLQILDILGDDGVKLCGNVDYAENSVSPGSWVVNPKYAESHQEELVRFLRAMYKGMDYGSKSDNYDQVAQWCADLIGADKDSLYQQRGDGYWYNSSEVADMVASGEMMQIYTVQQNMFVSSGDVEPATMLKVEDFVLADLMKEALP